MTVEILVKKTSPVENEAVNVDAPVKEQDFMNGLKKFIIKINWLLTPGKWFSEFSDLPVSLEEFSVKNSVPPEAEKTKV